MNVFGVILESACMSVRVSICGQSPWDPGVFLLYRIEPLPFSMACRKRRLKSETNGGFPRNS